MKTLKYSIMLGQLAFFAGASMAATQYVVPSDITESVDYGSDSVYYRPTTESGEVSMSVGEGVSISAAGVSFGPYSYRVNKEWQTINISSIDFKSGSKVLGTSSSYPGIYFGSGIGQITSQNATFESAYNAYFSSSWTSSGDTVNVAGSVYFQEVADFNISGMTLTQKGGERDIFYFQRGANASISDSTLNMVGRLYVQGGANATITNSTTTLGSYELSQISDGNLTIKGGSFTVENRYAYSPRSFTVSGGSFVMDGATVDMRGAVLGTRTSNVLDSVITIKNGTRFTADTIELYTYDSSSNESFLNIESGSVATIQVFGTYGRGNTGGTINVDAATLNVGTSLVQASDNGTQVYTTNLNITNGGNAIISGDLDVASVSLDGGNLSATSIIVGDDRSLAIAGASSVDADLLKVFETATVSLDEAATLDIGALELVVASELQSGMEFDLSNVFGDDTSIVLAAVGNNLVMSDSLGNSLSAVVSADGVITAVPEPATYAAIFGALALALAAYRKRA